MFIFPKVTNFTTLKVTTGIKKCHTEMQIVYIRLLNSWDNDDIDIGHLARSLSLYSKALEQWTFYKFITSKVHFQRGLKSVQVKKRSPITLQ